MHEITRPNRSQAHTGQTPNRGTVQCETDLENQPGPQRAQPTDRDKGLSHTDGGPKLPPIHRGLLSSVTNTN